MRNLFALILLFALSFTAVAEKPEASLPARPEFVYLVMQAIQDIDDMSPSSGEFEWQLSRSQAHKSATELIRGAQSEAEFAIAGDAWDFFQNKITIRMEIQAGTSAAASRADAETHRTRALHYSGIDPGRLYPHSKP